MDLKVKKRQLIQFVGDKTGKVACDPDHYKPGQTRWTQRQSERQSHIKQAGNKNVDQLYRKRKRLPWEAEISDDLGIAPDKQLT